MTDDDDRRFLQLIEEHKGILYRVACAYCRNKSDRGDLIQEIVLQSWRSFPRYDRGARFSTWMYRIAINVAISAHRTERRRIRDTVSIDDFGLDLAAADSAMDGASEDVRLLQRLIAALGELDRALMILYLDGYAHDEIAGVLGISATNASTRISRLKQKLQRDLDAANETPEKKDPPR